MCFILLLELRRLYVSHGRLVRNERFTICYRLVRVFGGDVRLEGKLLVLLDGRKDGVLSSLRVLLFGVLTLIVEAPLRSVGTVRHFGPGLSKPLFIHHLRGLL